MKVIHLSYSDIAGGAARAAYRIHQSLRFSDIDSRMRVVEASSGNCTVDAPSTTREKQMFALRRKVGSQWRRVMKTDNPIEHSPACLPSRWSRWLTRSNVDLVHLHWINYEMMSIADIGRLTQPTVWTLHDMWGFCGAEHYADDFRWRDGYLRGNRPAHESGFDLNRWTWRRKKKYWRRPFPLVAASRWMGQCVHQSALMREWPVTVIPYPIDTQVWQPVDRRVARQLLNLPLDARLVLFGAIGGEQDPRKGFDLLREALLRLRGRVERLELAVFGQSTPMKPLDLGFPLHYTGHLHDDVSLRLLYSAADAVVVPSRLEAFGQTASEAHACGTPVVAFAIGGLTDIVEHRRTGYLADAFDVEELAAGIEWVLENDEQHQRLRSAARERACALWSPEVVAKQYLQVYDAAVESFHREGHASRGPIPSSHEGRIGAG